MAVATNLAEYRQPKKPTRTGFVLIPNTQEDWIGENLDPYAARMFLRIKRRGPNWIWQAGRLSRESGQGHKRGIKSRKILIEASVILIGRRNKFGTIYEINGFQFWGVTSGPNFVPGINKLPTKMPDPRDPYKNHYKKTKTHLLVKGFQHKPDPVWVQPASSRTQTPICDPGPPLEKYIEEFDEPDETETFDDREMDLDMRDTFRETLQPEKVKRGRKPGVKDTDAQREARNSCAPRTSPEDRVWNSARGYGGGHQENKETLRTGLNNFVDRFFTNDEIERMMRCFSHNQFLKIINKIADASENEPLVLTRWMKEYGGWKNLFGIILKWK